MKLILASNNAHKLREFREILSPLGIEIIPQSEAGCHFEVDETGTTFEENAYLKAEAVTAATGLPAVADDSGLVVDWKACNKEAPASSHVSAVPFQTGTVLIPGASARVISRTKPPVKTVSAMIPSFVL